MNIAIIFAGGSGVRMGAGIPKQFLEINGKPVIVHTLQLFQYHREIDKIYVSIIAEYQDYMEELVADYRLSKVAAVLPGGETAQDSIYNALKRAEAENPADSVVLIHDGVRPFISREVITDNIRCVREKGNAITASYSYLLYGSNDGDCAKIAINRDTFMTLSTPQSFRYSAIVDLYKQVEEKKLFEKLIEHHTNVFMAELGIPLYFSKGSHANIKITTKEDIDLFLGYQLAKKYKTEHPEYCF